MENKLTFLVLGFLLSFGTIQAQIWTQQGEDIDGETVGGFCGYAVSLSSDGSIMAVGEDWNDENGTRAGQVRVFENISGTWLQKGQDLNGEAPYYMFGASISLSSDGSILAVGENGFDVGGGEYNHGRVKIFEYSAGNWVQIGSGIVGEAADDNSGMLSLSADGSIIAIGANSNDGNGNMAGHVRIFENISGTWIQLGEDIDGESGGDLSGSKISISSDGTIIAIGAHGNNGNGSGSGHVRVFEYISGIWTQIGSDINGESSLDQSGTSVSLNFSGSIVAIGAIYNDGGGSNSGQVRVFQFNNGEWVQLGGDIDGEAAEDSFGRSVSLNSDGNIVAVGASNNDGNGDDAGQVRIFELTDGSWAQIGENIDGEANGDLSGNAVSLSSDGSIVAVGAFKNDGNGVDAGHVRVYERFTTAIISPDEKQFSIYPNPTSGIFTIDYPDFGQSNIRITDITGEIIFYSNNAGEKQINISDFENGIYLIRIQTENGYLIKKLIKD